MTSYYAKPVPGSARLKTRGQQADPELVAVETLAPGQLERLEVAGETLGRVVIREAFVPVLAQVLDELVTAQSPIEQVLYLQLYRRSYGRDRNFCRVARSELCAITGLSLRRFNRALGGLVDKGHVRLLQRDRRGTLYRVLLPAEISGQRPGTEVLLGKLRPSREPSAETPGLPASARTLPGSPEETLEPVKRSHKVTPKRAMRSSLKRPPAGASERPKRHHKVTPKNEPRSVGGVAGLLLERVPVRRRSQLALDVLQDVTDLVEEGHPLVELARLVASCPLPRGGQPLRFADHVRQQRAEEI